VTGRPPAAKPVPTEPPPPAAPACGGPDPYAWMRDRDLPAMQDYLAAERAWYDRWLESVRGLRDELAAELAARLLPAEQSVNWRRDGRSYFTRTVPGQDYEQFCRAAGPGRPAQILLDENLLLADLACGGYLGLGVREVSPDGRLLAPRAGPGGDRSSPGHRTPAWCPATCSGVTCWWSSGMRPPPSCGSWTAGRESSG
jgi:oligopeptidase B